MSEINKIRLSGTDYDLRDVSATSVVEVTQQQYDDLPASAKTDNILYIITDSTVDYVTSAQTQSAINQAVSGKQDTLISGTNIKTINNESLLGSGNIDIQGGGGGVPESAFTSYTASTNSRIAEDEEVTAAGLNALNDKIDSISGANAIEVTQAEYETLVTGGTVDPNAFYIITDATPIDISQYWTSAQTQSAINQSVSGKASQTDLETVSGQVANKQDTLVSGTNIKTINNESILGSGNITIQGGGGKAIEAGRGISITTGETADTVSFDLPIYKTVSGTAHSLVLNNYSEPSANTFKAKYNTYINCRKPYVDNNSGQNNLIMGDACSAMSYTSDSFVGGFKSKIGDVRTFAFGEGSEALAIGAVAFGYDGQAFKPQVSKGNGSFACGGGTSANTAYSFATGYHNFTTRRSEFTSGQYNNSVSASTTFGDSGNTLFSVGNGTADNARHNAFEIRQNGDIYITSGGTDIKLQDNLGSTIEISSAITSGDTNPVQGGVLYDELIIESAETETTLTFDGYTSTDYPSGCTEVKVTVPEWEFEIVYFYNDDTQLGQVEIGRSEGGNLNVSLNFNGASYSVDNNEVVITYPTVTNVNKIAKQVDGTTVKAVYTQTTHLIDKVAEIEEVTAAALNTLNDALGGMKLVKLTQAEYNALATKDSSTLYIITS